MQLRGLLVAVVALAILSVGVYVSNKTKKDDDNKKSADTPKILAVPEDQLAQIEMKRKDGTVTTIKKGDKWQITTPEPLAADTDAVNGVVNAVGSLTADRVVEDNPADLAQFGLKQPSVVVTVT